MHDSVDADGARRATVQNLGPGVPVCVSHVRIRRRPVRPLGALRAEKMCEKRFRGRVVDPLQAASRDLHVQRNQINICRRHIGKCDRGAVPDRPGFCHTVQKQRRNQHDCQLEFYPLDRISTRGSAIVHDN